MELSVVDLLRGGWKWAAGFAAIGLIAGAMFVAFSPPLYTSVVQLLIESRGNPVTNRDGASSAPLEIPEVESQIELIRSERIAIAALEALQLKHEAELITPRNAIIAGAVSLLRSAYQAAAGYFAAGEPRSLGDEDELRRARLALALRGSLSVYRAGASYVAGVSFTSGDPVRAAAVANAVADAYVRYQVAHRSELWRSAGEWMQQRLSELREEANSAARAAQEFKAQNQIVEAGRRGLVSEQQLEELNTTLSATRAHTLEAASKYSQIMELLAARDLEATVSDALKDASIIRMRDQLAELTSQASQLAARFGNTHAGVTALRAEMSQIRSAMRNELTRIAEGYKSDLAVSRDKEQSLSREFERVMSEVSVLNQARVRARELDRAANTLDTIYTNLQQRYLDAVNQQTFPQPTAQVITRASVPEAASSPRVGLTLLLASVCGAGIGLCFSVSRRALDRTVRGPAQILAMGLRCLAVLPPPERDPAFRGAWKRLRKAAAGSGGALSRADLAYNFVHHCPRSGYGLMLEQVRAELHVLSRLRRLQVIGIAAAGPRGQATTLAANLAVLLSRPAGARAVLIALDEGELIRGDQQGVGLRDIVTGGAALDDALRDTEFGYRVIGVGSSYPGEITTDIFAAQGFERAMACLRSEADFILFSMPSLYDSAAARELSPELDAVIILAEQGASTLDAIRDALSPFDSDLGKVIGVVLNTGRKCRNSPRGGTSPRGLSFNRAPQLERASV
jgi:succinoglycan biosynthesis transport protein ExoP